MGPMFSPVPSPPNIVGALVQEYCRESNDTSPPYEFRERHYLVLLADFEGRQVER